jgi:hypothetical protein
MFGNGQRSAGQCETSPLSTTARPERTKRVSKRSGVNSDGFWTSETGAGDLIVEQRLYCTTEPSNKGARRTKPALLPPSRQEIERPNDSSR